MTDARYNVVFIGRSGCGKGTQAELLQKILEKKYGLGSVLYVYAGSRFRELAGHSEFLTARLLQKKVLEAGEKAPDALAIWAYMTELIYGANETNHIIVDGSPRTLLEAETLGEMFDFYGRKNIFYLYLDISEELAMSRMLARGRSDDNSESIKRRFAYFKKDVEPAIEYYKKDSKHKFLEINGKQPVEKVHEDIVKALGL